MTIVCVKSGVMAADSKCNLSDGSFLTKCQKIYRLENGALLGTAGDADCRELRTLLGKSKCTTRTVQMPSREVLSLTRTTFEGILAFPNGKLFLVYVNPTDVGSSLSEWSGAIVEIEESVAAIGSGYQFALGALRAGATAIQAVQISCHYDANCGLPVRHEKIKKEEK